MADIEIPVFEMPTQYTICALDADHIDAHLFEVQVEYRGGGRWAVCRWKRCLDAAGDWDYESIPGEREDEWLATHRFDLETALRLARVAAPKLTVNGRRAADLARRRASSASPEGNTDA